MLKLKAAQRWWIHPTHCFEIEKKAFLDVTGQSIFQWLLSLDWSGLSMALNS